MPKIIDSFDGQYRFLSNFYLTPIVYEDITYPSSEHAYQAAKFWPEKTKLLIANTHSPGKAKRLGRGSGLRDDWEEVKDSIMSDIVEIKFRTHKDLAKKLLDTGNARLVEGNAWGDTYWGVCNGVGQNKLGEILMSVRVHLNLWLLYEQDKEEHLAR